MCVYVDRDDKYIVYVLDDPTYIQPYTQIPVCPLSIV